ncbi:MAG TPA: hypothetical protein P5561_01020 [Candidatus Omnitrophota bacterium]|nr:hypothetical protein [Candidatus Omnitrophota bacterium]HRY85094.1 hypothetical protein [Candidatus Omnitrophota bacterium]
MKADQLKISESTNNYFRCLAKAMDRTRQLLCRKDLTPSHKGIHSVKSILYAAIERAGMESERLISAQELLRELLAFVALQADPAPGEREEALRILKKLQAHHFMINNDVSR